MEKESYFNIPEHEQREILEYYSNHLSKRDKILEKDIWLCKVLDILFNIPNKHPMAFKGGTSLSKVFGIIDRFSEDIDITLDFHSFNISESLHSGMSKTKIKLLGEKLKKCTKEYRDEVIVPALQASLKELPQYCNIKTDESGEKIWISYPSVLSKKQTSLYMKEEVLIELGGKNVIEPNEIHTIKPYIALENELIQFTEPNVVVLSPQRTFWEKATLIHVECHRGLRDNAERLSRHWYDLVKLYEKGIGKSAIENTNLLLDVVNHKSIFFNASYANYSDCLNKKFKLLPDENSINKLKKDYTKMTEAGMIYDDDSFTFEYIIEKIKEITFQINLNTRKK